MSKKSKKSEVFTEIFGIHSVKAALKNKSRKHKKIIISNEKKLNFNDEALNNLERE